ncbi:hypothetical protein DRO56_05535 [Candidatus Bathyarchaeota archaeon]|nr:MAG: hypothetical protein DRO56_05535 [Candidatus Bathyarchaeota archaeon]
MQFRLDICASILSTVYAAQGYKEGGRYAYDIWLRVLGLLAMSAPFLIPPEMIKILLHHTYLL